MSIAADTREGILSIRVRDPRMVDENELEGLEQEILAMLDKSTEERVILDFEKVQFMSSSMLGKLVKSAQRLHLGWRKIIVPDKR